VEEKISLDQGKYVPLLRTTTKESYEHKMKNRFDQIYSVSVQQHLIKY